MSKAKLYYEENINESNKRLEGLRGITTALAIVRLVIVILAIVTTYFLYENRIFEYIIIELGLYIGVFIIVAYFHNNRLEEKRKNQIIVDVNEKGLKRIDGTWREFKDKGEEFLEDTHGFSGDLDVFGASSLFQWINSTNTKFGRISLANILKLNKIPRKEEIIERQSAIKELSDKVDWRQKLIVESTFKKVCKDDVEELITWATEKKKVGFALKVIPYLCIAVTLAGILITIMKIIPFSYLLLVFMFNYLVVKILTKDLGEIVNLFHKHQKDIEAYSNLLGLIEEEEFNSEFLKDLKSRINNKENISCKKEMKSLKKLIDWLGDSSANAYYLLLNVTILSDTFIIRNLESWRGKNGKYLEEWLKVMGEFEALSSISGIAYNFESFTYPVILDEAEIYGVNIGHPMIGEKAISNSFSLKGKEKVALITGSNMSGKSTFLRTIGLNILLSYIGAPTCSESFNCGAFNIYTCMRTKDNLEESISSFYAEILRIKYLIEAAKRGEKVFFLLDEIFKGTNSMDRHEGAKVLINQLVNCGGMGLVSTHDLELCELEKTKNWLVNYNFQEYYDNNKIKFDYKLRDGGSTTRNAIHLMKLAGIDFNEYK
ncbi:MutS-related protein [Clostridium gasigenes]|uniref:MutS domain V n=1 Tax=Clostridium gasigenes TaxID=94869 RepID=A0A1H0RZ50_9CLOT|nr:MutS family DNA mismatch repair protein [Clostridium gasigenes]MBB6622657.1 DNA mismatch repair protein MutS [Clostridium gasigenes]MBU3136613.1 DNA mismatch repair protein MutS [Clostridium gasigenes]NKF06348.1 DNA mismatch repair protein MutS [Clostridium gasigenes]QSW20231.1 DNA mismatch repair protein MutS [Clostridium gasigenes]SDP34657.1 MutS domain V [Clostridium gasigenes]